MDPSILYSQTLSQLGEIEIRMTSPAGDALIQAASPNDHRRAVQTLLNVHQVRLALGNAALVAIADKLKANEADLVAGTAAVKASLDALDNLVKILNTVSALVEVVAKIAPLL